MSEVQKEIKLLQEQVKKILERFPISRDNDKYLTWMTWNGFYGINDKIDVKIFLELPSEGSITRVRRKIQNEMKLYPPTSYKIAKARGWMETEWKQAMGYHTADINQLSLI